MGCGGSKELRPERGIVGWVGSKPAKELRPRGLSPKTLEILLNHHSLKERFTYQLVAYILDYLHDDLKYFVMPVSRRRMPCDQQLSIGLFNFLASEYTDTFRDLLLSKRFKSKVIRTGAIGGYLELIKWAKGFPSCEWNAEVCALAAGQGHLELLEWLRSRGCPWDSRTTAAATKSTDIRVLQYCCQNK